MSPQKRVSPNSKWERVIAGLDEEILVDPNLGGSLDPAIQEACSTLGDVELAELVLRLNRALKSQGLERKLSLHMLDMLGRMVAELENTFVPISGHTQLFGARSSEREFLLSFRAAVLYFCQRTQGYLSRWPGGIKSILQELEEGDASVTRVATRDGVQMVPRASLRALADQLTALHSEAQAPLDEVHDLVEQCLGDPSLGASFAAAIREAVESLANLLSEFPDNVHTLREETRKQDEGLFLTTLEAVQRSGSSSTPAP